MGLIILGNNSIECCPTQVMWKPRKQIDPPFSQSKHQKLGFFYSRVVGQYGIILAPWIVPFFHSTGQFTCRRFTAVNKGHLIKPFYSPNDSSTPFKNGKFLRRSLVMQIQKYKNRIQYIQVISVISYNPSNLCNSRTINLSNWESTIVVLTRVVG